MHLVRRGRALPLGHPSDPQLGKVVRSNHNATGLGALGSAGIERVVDHEQRRPDQQRMQQGFA